MTTIINLQGIQTPGGEEDRDIAYIKVNIDGNEYDWKIYVPQNIDLTYYLENIKEYVALDIKQKELDWQNLEPKTKTITDPMTGETITVNINKEEIVAPTIPDYYALRRNEYPSLADQLGAMWKGPDSTEYKQLQQKILYVKAKYPKP